MSTLRASGDVGDGLRAVAATIAEARRRLEEGEDVAIAPIMEPLRGLLSSMRTSPTGGGVGQETALLALMDELEQLAALATEQREQIARGLGNLAGARRASTAYLAPRKQP